MTDPSKNPTAARSRCSFKATLRSSARILFSCACDSERRCCPACHAVPIIPATAAPPIMTAAPTMLRSNSRIGLVATAQTTASSVPRLASGTSHLRMYSSVKPAARTETAPFALLAMISTRPRAVAEHRRQAGELGGARLGAESIAFELRIVGQDDATVPVARTRFDALPAPGLELLAAERIELRERPLGVDRPPEHPRPDAQVFGIDHPCPRLADRGLTELGGERHERLVPARYGKGARLVIEVLGVDPDLAHERVGGRAISGLTHPENERLDARRRCIAGRVPDLRHRGR